MATVEREKVSDTDSDLIQNIQHDCDDERKPEYTNTNIINSWMKWIAGKTKSLTLSDTVERMQGDIFDLQQENTKQHEELASCY